MRIEVDQSNKIEQTNKYTALAFSNGKSSTIIISAIEKQKLQKEFRRLGMSRAFVFQTFNIMIYLLLKSHLKNIEEITIDREYPGKEQAMIDHIASIFLKNHIVLDRKIIRFSEIGKLSNAHLKTFESSQTKKAKIKVTAKDILAILLN